MSSHFKKTTLRTAVLGLASVARVPVVQAAFIPGGIIGRSPFYRIFSGLLGAPFFASQTNSSHTASIFLTIRKCVIAAHP